MRRRRALSSTVVLLILAGGCTRVKDPGPPPTSSARPGGTLRVALYSADGGVSGWCPFLMCGRTFDPQAATFVDEFELARCCFMRTLLTYSGTSVADGGTALRPDMARSLPAISADGLTWTFSLRRGVRYAPPMAGREIVAGDFVRSLERTFTPSGPAIPWADGGTIGGYWTDTYLHNVVAGADQFTAGDADHVSGLEAPDPHTLVIHLTEPVGDLGYRLALPQLGPIPPNPAHPQDPMGVAQGHDFDYGDVMVSSGPYMFEGSEKLAYDLPPEDQFPPAGNAPDRAVLVRNPSWSRAVDPTRMAWPDRMEFTVVGSAKQAEDAIQEGTADVVLNWAGDAAATARWLDDPGLRPRTVLAPADAMFYVPINLAIPPFDDLHVRRAMNLAIDRTAIAATLQDTVDGLTHEVFTHFGLDSFEDNLLLSYAAPGVGPLANTDAAREEMRQSRYDSDGDGRCDDPSCSGVNLIARASDESSVKAARMLAGQLRDIGLGIHVRAVDDDEYFEGFGDPSRHVALQIGGWLKDFPNASTFFPLLLGSENIPGPNPTMVGATPAQLRRYGYSVRSVPNVDDRIATCTRSVFEAQTTCWAQLDQYLSEQVVPWIPLTQSKNGWFVSDRVAELNVDASIAVPVPALDNIRLKPDAAEEPPSPTPQSSGSAPPPIPDGVYRVTLTLADIVRFGGAKDGLEDSGTFTVALRDGTFFWHQRGDHTIFNPIGVGVYTGTSNTIRFHQTQPWFAVADLSDLTWRMDGDALVFDLPRCTGPAAKDRFYCGWQKAMYTAHPWERVPKVSGGWF